MIKATITGYVGNDAKTEIYNGKEVIRFSVASSRTYVDRQTGEQIETTQWVNCSLWREAKFAERFRKGTLVAIVGEMKCGIYYDKNERPQTDLKCGVDSWEILRYPTPNDTNNSLPLQSNSEATPQAPDDDESPF